MYGKDTIKKLGVVTPRGVEGNHCAGQEEDGEAGGGGGPGHRHPKAPVAHHVRHRARALIGSDYRCTWGTIGITKNAFYFFGQSVSLNLQTVHLLFNFTFTPILYHSKSK